MHKNARTITSDPINPVKNFDLTSKTMNQEWSNRQGKNTGYFIQDILKLNTKVC